MRRTPRRASMVVAGALIVFMALVIYRSLHLAGVRCEVCITFQGRSQCRTVEGETHDDALMAATTNACAYLASGVTDGMACARTAPTRSECVAAD